MSARRDLTLDEALMMWGMRTAGGRLKSAGLHPQTGGEEGVDEGESIKRYVEAVEGFGRARPVLVWVYCRFKPLESFPIRVPGMSFVGSLFSRGWGDMVHTPAPDVARLVLRGFESALAERLLRDPWVRPGGWV